MRRPWNSFWHRKTVRSGICPLSTDFVLTMPHGEALAIPDEVNLFQKIRANLLKGYSEQHQKRARHKKRVSENRFLFNGGEGGIRTLGTQLTYTHFPGVLLQPLGHLTICSNTCFSPRAGGVLYITFATKAKRIYRCA